MSFNKLYDFIHVCMSFSYIQVYTFRKVLYISIYQNVYEAGSFTVPASELLEGWNA